MPRQVAVYTDFSGGWVPSVDPSALADNQLAVLTNMLPKTGGYLESREGCTQTYTAAAGEVLLDSWEWVTDAGTALDCLLIAKAGGHVLRIDSHDVVVAGAAVGSSAFKEYLYVADGSNFRKVSTAGVAAKVEAPTAVYTTAPTVASYATPESPAATFTFADTSGTYLVVPVTCLLPAGTWKGGMSFVDTYGNEGTIAESASGAVSITNGRVAWGSVPTTGTAAITKQRFYVQRSGESVWYFCGERAKGTSGYAYPYSYTQPLSTTQAPQIAAATYTWQIVGVTATGTLEASPAVSLAVTAAHLAKVTCPIAQAGVLTYNLYRRASGAAAAKLVRTGIVASGSTVDSYDQVADANLGAGLPNMERIHRCTMIARHPTSGRFFAAGDSADSSTVYYSAPNEPWTWEGDGELSPTGGEGPILALTTFGDALLVSYASGWWVYRGVDPATDGSWFRLPANVGCVAPKSITQTANSLTFLGKGGIYSISAALLDLSVVMQPGEELLSNIASPAVLDVIASISAESEVASVYDPARQLLLVAYRAAGSANDKVLALHWPTRAYALIEGWSVVNWLLRKDGTLTYTSADGQYDAFSGATDDGTPISWEAETKGLNMGAAAMQKKLKKTVLSCRAPTATTVSLTVDCDGDSETVSLPLAPTSTEVYSDMEERVRLRGHRFVFNVSGAGSGVQVHGLTVEFAPGKLRGTR